MSGLNIPTRNEYPNLWKRGLIQSRIRDRAEHRCEECGMPFIPGTNLACTHRRKNGQAFVGTVHHIDGDKSNCSWRNLVFLCQRCHYRLHIWGWIPGKPLPLAWRNQPPMWVIRRGLAFQENPQLVLLDTENNHAAQLEE